MHLPFSKKKKKNPCIHVSEGGIQWVSLGVVAAGGAVMTGELRRSGRGGRARRAEQ